MKKYRKKPVVIEAQQWDGTVEDASRIIDWILNGGHTARFRSSDPDAGVDRSIAIDTLEGTHTTSPGDFVIRGVQGEFYPCKPDIFEATYDEVSA